MAVSSRFLLVKNCVQNSTFLKNDAVSMTHWVSVNPFYEGDPFQDWTKNLVTFGSLVCYSVLFACLASIGDCPCVLRCGVVLINERRYGDTYITYVSILYIGINHCIALLLALMTCCWWCVLCRVGLIDWLIDWFCSLDWRIKNL